MVWCLINLSGEPGAAHSVWASYRFVEESRSARCEKAEPTCVSVVYLSWSNAVSVWIPLRTHTSKQTYTKQQIIIPHETCLIFACEDRQKEGSLSSFWLPEAMPAWRTQGTRWRVCAGWK